MQSLSLLKEKGFVSNFKNDCNNNYEIKCCSNSESYHDYSNNNESECDNNYKRDYECYSITNKEYD